jgi:pilus assembly protein CpaF
LDGSRVNAIISPLSTKGASLTIRKFPQKAFQMKDMLEFSSLNKEMLIYLEECIKNKKNILVSGGTGAGKTSTLNALAGMISREERIITIEDVAEIRIEHPHLVSLETRSENIEGNGEISIRRLLKNALRMRPDRIVVGEIRGGEAFDMLQAMNTGHKGSLTTVHANAPLESLFRVESMVLMGGIDMPITAIRPQVIQAIDLIIQQERLSDGSRKIVHIAEVMKDLQVSEYKIKTIFKYDKNSQKFISNSI